MTSCQDLSLRVGFEQNARPELPPRKSSQAVHHGCFYLIGSPRRTSTEAADPRRRRDKVVATLRLLRTAGSDHCSGSWNMSVDSLDDAPVSLVGNTLQGPRCQDM